MSKNVIYVVFALPSFEGLIIECVKPIRLQSNLDWLIHSIVWYEWLMSFTPRWTIVECIIEAWDIWCFLLMELEHLKPKGKMNALFIQSGVNKLVNGGAN